MNDLQALGKLPGFTIYWKGQMVTIPDFVFGTTCSRGVTILRVYCSSEDEAIQMINSATGLTSQGKSAWLHCIRTEWSKPRAWWDYLGIGAKGIMIIAIIGVGLWVTSYLVVPSIRQLRKKE